jgi:hypothetical protein
LGKKRKTSQKTNHTMANLTQMAMIKVLGQWLLALLLNLLVEETNKSFFGHDNEQGP